MPTTMPSTPPHRQVKRSLDPALGQLERRRDVEANPLNRRPSRLHPPSDVSPSSLCPRCTGLTKEVWSLFHKMRTSPSLTPRLESFTVMLELCAREGGRAQEAVTLMQDLEHAGRQRTFAMTCCH